MDTYREGTTGVYLRDVPAAKKLKLGLLFLPHYDSTPGTNSEHSDVIVCSTEAGTADSEARSDAGTADSEARSDVGTADNEAMSDIGTADNEARSDIGTADSDTEEGPSFHETVLDKILGCCIRLKYTLARLHSKGLFPYPVEGIIPLLERLEEKYEGGTCIPQ